MLIVTSESILLHYVIGEAFCQVIDHYVCCRYNKWDDLELHLVKIEIHTVRNDKERFLSTLILICQCVSKLISYHSKQHHLNKIYVTNKEANKYITI